MAFGCEAWEAKVGEWVSVCVFGGVLHAACRMHLVRTALPCTPIPACCTLPTLVHGRCTAGPFCRLPNTHQHAHQPPPHTYTPLQLSRAFAVSLVHPPTTPLRALHTRALPPRLQLFPDEVVRGGPAFAVSLVLTAIEPRMRKAAELGSWQVGLCLLGFRVSLKCLVTCAWLCPGRVFLKHLLAVSSADRVPHWLNSLPPCSTACYRQVISPSAAYGRLEVVPDLHGIQEKVSLRCLLVCVLSS